MAFSASDAALEGFKITRARPTAALVWAGVQLVLAIVDSLVVSAIVGPRAEAVLNPMTMLGHPEQLSAAMWQATETSAISALLGVIANGFLYAAANRAVMEPSRGGPGWLAFGRDELRQMAVLALYVIVLFAAYIGGTFVAAAAFGLVLMPLLGNVGVVLTAVLAVLVDLPFVVWVGVRLSLAPPATFAERRVVFFDTWKLTRGRFWQLLGAYLVSWLLAGLVFVLVIAIATVAFLVTGGSPEALTAPRTFDLAWILKPANLVLLLFSALSYGLTSLIVLTPPAYIYRLLAGRREAAFS